VQQKGIYKMTKNILSTNLKEIEGIRVVCNKCSANWFLPFGFQNAPRKCISCENEMPMNTLIILMEKFQEVINLSKKQGFDVILETEQK